MDSKTKRLQKEEDQRELFKKVVAHREDQNSVTDTCRTFGFSHVKYYSLLRKFKYNDITDRSTTLFDRYNKNKEGGEEYGYQRDNNRMQFEYQKDENRDQDKINKEYLDNLNNIAKKTIEKNKALYIDKK